MQAKLWVLVFVDTSGEEPKVVKFGPTSENPGLLYRYDMCWPSAADRRVVVPVMDGGLLRVSKHDLAGALAAREGQA